MKKVSYLMLVVLLTTGCATGYYAPHNVNQFGTQTQVVLGQANFRVVRHLEVVIDINNTNLKRADVEKSAYAELLRRANLTGSQALINVVIEEVRRESSNIFRVLFCGIHKVTQHVAARATIIEFLDDTGNPIASPTLLNQGTAPREELSNNNTDFTDAMPSTDKTIESINLSIFIDENFKKACLKIADTDKDGIISADEADNVTKMEIAGLKISSLQGIECFTNLLELNAMSNNLREVDLSQNKKLRKAYFNSNPNLILIYFANYSNVKTTAPKNIIKYK